MDTRILLYRLQSSWCLTVASQANIIMTRCQASNLLDFRDQINVHSSVNYENGPRNAPLLEDSKKCETWPSLTLVSTTFKVLKERRFSIPNSNYQIIHVAHKMVLYQNHYAINIMIIIDVGIINTEMIS